jgi:tetratricopeptide (TPR) repeat protein
MRAIIEDKNSIRHTASVGMALLFACGLAIAQEPSWQTEYVLGMAKYEQGRYDEAAAAFENAIACDPAPRQGAIDYLPWLYLAVSRYRAGDEEHATQAFAMSRRHGVAEHSEMGAELFARYSAELDDPGMDAGAFGPGTAVPTVVLDAAEAERIRDQVLRKCALAADVDDNKLPWYFHYLYGEALMDAGDPRRALDAFTLGANVREEPKRNKRMYGMWYVDYLPYFQIALAHARLGHWESARSALEMSNLLGEFRPEDPNYPAFLALERQVRGALGPGG